MTRREDRRWVFCGARAAGLRTAGGSHVGDWLTARWAMTKCTEIATAEAHVCTMWPHHAVWKQMTYADCSHSMGYGLRLSTSFRIHRITSANCSLQSQVGLEIQRLQMSSASLLKRHFACFISRQLRQANRRTNRLKESDSTCPPPTFGRIQSQNVIRWTKRLCL